MELSISNSCQLSPVRVARHIARASLLSSLTAVKRKIYLEVPVEDHYLLTVRLINIFLLHWKCCYITKFLLTLNSHLASLFLAFGHIIVECGANLKKRGLQTNISQ